MGEVVSTVLTCYKTFLFKRNGVKRGGLELKGKRLPLNPSKLQCREGKLTRSESRSPLIIKNQMTKPATYSSRISTDIPLYESPEASFDDYLENKTRVVEAIFPDKRSSQRLNEEEWRIQMLPLQILFLTAWPVIDMRVRCKSQGIGYPPGIPQDISKVVELDIIRWELQGLDDILKPSEFSLCVKGSFYPDRHGAETQLKGQLQMDINFDLPPVVSWIPEDVRFRVVESASFDEYLEDKNRMVKAIFPDKRRSQRLNEEEWRIQMLPMQFMFLTAWPVIYMRLRHRSRGIGYPPGIPREVTKVVELDITRWELQGLDNILKLSEFSLCVKGSLYPERRGARSQLKFQLQMNISSVLPPVLSLVPEDVRFGVVESVLKTLVEDMKHKVNGSLLADYGEFKKEKLKAKV